MMDASSWPRSVQTATVIHSSPHLQGEFWIRFDAPPRSSSWLAAQRKWFGLVLARVGLWAAPRGCPRPPPLRRRLGTSAALAPRATPRPPHATPAYGQVHATRRAPRCPPPTVRRRRGGAGPAPRPGTLTAWGFCGGTTCHCAARFGRGRGRRRVPPRDGGAAVAGRHGRVGPVPPVFRPPPPTPRPAERGVSFSCSPLPRPPIFFFLYLARLESVRLPVTPPPPPLTVVDPAAGPPCSRLGSLVIPLQRSWPSC